MVVRQVLDSSDNGASLFGMAFGKVTLVAIVRSVEHTSTKITYRLEDHTGEIEAHFWLEEGETNNVPKVVVNAYARIFGSIRNQEDGKTLMIFRMMPIEINDYTNHLLEVLHCRFKAEQYAKEIAGEYPNNASFAGNGSGSLGRDSASMNSTGLDAKHFLIFKAIQQSKTEDGISTKELENKFSHFSANEIK